MLKRADYTSVKHRTIDMVSDPKAEGAEGMEYIASYTVK